MYSCSAGCAAACDAEPTPVPDVTCRLRLTGGMARYDWGIKGQAFDMSRPGALRFLMKQASGSR